MNLTRGDPQHSVHKDWQRRPRTSTHSSSHIYLHPFGWKRSVPAEKKKKTAVRVFKSDHVINFHPQIIQFVPFFSCLVIWVLDYSSAGRESVPPSLLPSRPSRSHTLIKPLPHFIVSHLSHFLSSVQTPPPPSYFPSLVFLFLFSCLAVSILITQSPLEWEGLRCLAELKVMWLFMSLFKKERKVDGGFSRASSRGRWVMSGRAEACLSGCLSLCSPFFVCLLTCQREEDARTILQKAANKIKCFENRLILCLETGGGCPI